jgi:hypothetical protein
MTQDSHGSQDSQGSKDAKDSKKRKRRGRVLLAAAGMGVVAITYVGCGESGPVPVGNLRPLDCDAGISSPACARPDSGTSSDAG